MLPHGERLHSRWVKLDLIDKDLDTPPRLPYLYRGARNDRNAFLAPLTVSAPITQPESPGLYTPWEGGVKLSGLIFDSYYPFTV